MSSAEATRPRGPQAHPRLILGTAGHIDHGKTSLVKALTGVDTDRLKEEKERGITIDLGFAELELAGGLHFGMVDVPGHEGFIRNMVAGATGMDVVLMVVAADEGVMPQTREHMAIVRLLGVRSLVVAMTKTDLVEEEWLELVESDLADFLDLEGYGGSRIVATSAASGAGLDDLRDALAEIGRAAMPRSDDDLLRLPVDRVFTVKGTGTVVTGTLWSGRVQVGDRLRLLPGSFEGRVRMLQVHGQQVDTVQAGARTAVALTGSDISRDDLFRGQSLVVGAGWDETLMLTTRVRMLEGTAWMIEHNQRVRVHLGTAEVMARVALFEDTPLAPGATGWVQLRLEAPVLARAGDRLVLRSYSPVTTIGGGEVAEPVPVKRRRLDHDTRVALAQVLDGAPAESGDAALRLAGFGGTGAAALPVRARLTPAEANGLANDPARAFKGSHRVFHAAVADQARACVLERVGQYHRDEPLSPGIPLETLRGVLGSEAGPGLAEAIVQGLVESGELAKDAGIAHLPDFEPTLGLAQEALRKALARAYEEAGLQAPSIKELPPELRDAPDTRRLLALLERSGTIRAIAEDLYLDAGALARAQELIQEKLGGRSGLGPAEFRELFGVTRKHLIPLLEYYDRMGVTIRRKNGRSVP